MTEASLAATSFAPLDLLLANLTISDQRIHTGLRQPLPCAVHAKAESLGLNSILATKSLVIVGASLLYSFAIGIMLRSSPDGRKGEPKKRATRRRLYIVIPIVSALLPGDGESIHSWRRSH